MYEHRFDDAREWLKADSRREPVSIMPKKLAAEVLGISFAAVSDAVRKGALRSVLIGEKTYLSAPSVYARLHRDITQSEEVHDQLAVLAAKRRTIFYGKFMEGLGLSSQSPADRNRIGVLLGDVSRRSMKERRVMLSAIVHRKSAEPTIPNSSFFELARELGKKVPRGEERKFLDREMKRVWDAYEGEA